MLFALSLLGCKEAPDSDVPTPDVPVETADTAVERPNVLILLADDLGVDNVGVYGVHPHHANTPTIDALAAEGMRFTTTWATPSCSPARAQVLTGRHGRRYGMGIRIDMGPSGAPFKLREEEVTLGELARTAGYSTSFVGKWHLNHFAADWELAPRVQGFDWFAISGGNLPITSSGQLGEYYHWERNENGVIAFSNTYATTAQVDDALSRIEAMPEPWLLVVAFNAPHEPFQPPPPALHTLGPVVGQPIPVRYRAAVEAMDTEIGRLLGGIPADVRSRTNVVFTADNGTPQEAVLAPIPHLQGKPSLTEGGLRVPLLVTGPGIEPGVTDAMTALTDLLPTVAGWMGADLVGPDGEPLALDGFDLRPWLDDPATPDGRALLYADRFTQYDHPNDSPVLERAVRTRRWKYATDGELEFLFDLDASPYDLLSTDLLQGGTFDPAVLDDMRQRLDQAVAERPFEYP
ncbi:MAG: sulfatase-like hydrolase/transferase [Alphaproteobacteria bacterium]|nr:sulfatase-like hydrolase/transferase [Alphaproteobacteria bacterium]